MIKIDDKHYIEDDSVALRSIWCLFMRHYNPDDYMYMHSDNLGNHYFKNTVSREYVTVHEEVM
jgi:hypothetical protein